MGHLFEIRLLSENAPSDSISPLSTLSVYRKKARQLVDFKTQSHNRLLRESPLNTEMALAKTECDGIQCKSKGRVRSYM